MHPLEKTPYLNDFWTPDVTGLGYDHLRDELVHLARKADPPFAVAVYGGWGSGKTSLLRATMNQLGGELLQLSPDEGLQKDRFEATKFIRSRWDDLRPKAKSDEEKANAHIRCIWFNPWQHQFEKHPMIALLHEIRQQFDIKLKLLDSGEKMFHVALKTGLRLLDDLTASATKLVFGHGVKLGIDKIEKTGVDYEKQHYQSRLDSQRFQMHFEDAVAHLASSTNQLDEQGRLVIFVDDLDRCESSQVLHLLEAIKLYFATRRCVFVVGLDPNHTEQALTKQGLDRDHQARHYLHKLFQLSFQLPRSRHFAAFIQNLLNAMPDAAGVFEPNPAREKQQPAGELARFLTEILEANPRRVKNFLNRLYFKSRVIVKIRITDAPTKTKVDPYKISLLLALQYYFPITYRFLEENPDDLKTVQDVMKFTRLDQSSDGAQAMMAKECHLPQTERVGANDTGEPITFTCLEKDHYTDHDAGYEVRKRFKNRFANMEINDYQLKEYLRP
jgi:hypothetical protein